MREAAQSVVKEIEAAGGKATAIQADAADADAVMAAVEKTVATFGRLDVLVNNAGTGFPKPFEEATLEEMDRVIDINIRGVFVATKAALKHMKDGGRIINIGSCVGERMMTPGLVPYSATKGAVKMFTQGLAREVGGRAITVNNVQPGPIDTDLNPAAGDWATPQIATHCAETLWDRRRSRRPGVVRGRSGSILHHRREPDGRRRHQRLTIGRPPGKIQLRRDDPIVSPEHAYMLPRSGLGLAKRSVRDAPQSPRYKPWPPPPQY